MVGDFFGFTAVDLIMKDISLDMFNQMKKLLSFGENIEIINTIRKDIKYIMDITNPETNRVFFYINKEDVDVDINIAEYNRLYNATKRRNTDYKSIYDVIDFVYNNVKDKSSNEYVSYLVINNNCELDKYTSLSLPSKRVLSKICSEPSRMLLEAYYQSAKNINNEISKNAFITIFGVSADVITKVGNEYFILNAMYNFCNKIQSNKEREDKAIEEIKKLANLRDTTSDRLKTSDSIENLKQSVNNNINKILKDVTDDELKKELKISDELKGIGVHGYNPFFDKFYKKFKQTKILSLPQSPNIEKGSVCDRFLDEVLKIIEDKSFKV